MHYIIFLLLKNLINVLIFIDNPQESQTLIFFALEKEIFRRLIRKNEDKDYTLKDKNGLRNSK